MRFLISLFLVTVLSACERDATPTTSVVTSTENPEVASGFRTVAPVLAHEYLVVTANPHATRAGERVLAAGGNAIDAAVAIQAMLTLVEPQSSGIGGGAFLLFWHAEERKLYTLDARETAPSVATPELFLNAAGESPRWIDAVIGGRSVGVPGVVKGLEAAHQRFGESPWETLFTDTIELASRGFQVSPRLAHLVATEMNPGLRKMPVIQDYFYPNNEPLAEGDLLKNEALALSLSRIAKGGAEAFYEGEIAQAIVDAVQNAPIAPGLLSMEDMAHYEVKWREPVCGGYHDYTVCSMGLPSSGGITLLQTLGMLEGFELSSRSIEEGLHFFTQASRLAFADRNQYLADSDFVDVPVEEMLHPTYLRQRAALIGANDMDKAAAGSPSEALSYAEPTMMELPSTSHFSIVDSNGNIVSMTTSIEMGFGSTVMAGGFLLNNQLTDFSLIPEKNGDLVANRVQPGKRPRSSMTPTIIFDEGGHPVYALGSPGGSHIINYVAKVVLGIVDWDMTLQQAIEMPHVSNLNSATVIEQGRAPETWIQSLQTSGHEIVKRDMTSGVARHIFTGRMLCLKLELTREEKV